MLSALLLNLGIFGNSLKAKNICSPGFNCHGCPWAVGACPIGVLAFGSSILSFPFLALGTILLIGTLFGRLVCAFVCPFGLLQELLYRIPTPKIQLPRATRYLKYAALLLFVFLLPALFGFKIFGYLHLNESTYALKEDKIALTVKVQNDGTEPVVAPQLEVAFRAKGSKEVTAKETASFPNITVLPGENATLEGLVPNRLQGGEVLISSPQSLVTQLPQYDWTYYCRLCPNGFLIAGVPSYFAEAPGGNWKNPDYFRDWIAVKWPVAAITAVFLLLMILTSRPFCRTFCPLGALYALTAPVALSRIKLDKSACIHCHACSRVCPVDLDVPKEVGGPECLACGDCQTACPQNGIRREFGFGKKK